MIPETAAFQSGLLSSWWPGRRRGAERQDARRRDRHRRRSRDAPRCRAVSGMVRAGDRARTRRRNGQRALPARRRPVRALAPDASRDGPGGERLCVAAKARPRSPARDPRSARPRPARARIPVGVGCLPVARRRERNRREARRCAGSGDRPGAFPHRAAAARSRGRSASRPIRFVPRHPGTTP
jgi:hypothetical protein